MTRMNRVLRSKHHVLTAWAVRFDGTMYVAATIRNAKDLYDNEINCELNEALEDLSVEKVEFVPARKCSDGVHHAVGKPVHVIVGA